MIHQNVTAVKKDDIAYTSPSTAENQNESEKVYVREPTAPAPIIRILEIERYERKDILNTNVFVLIQMILRRWQDSTQEKMLLTFLSI